MRSDILGKVAMDLLSIPALTARGIRRRLIKPVLADIAADITPIHFDIIHLLQEEGTLHVAEIGARLQLAKAQMTKLLDKLVALGIVARQMDSPDRRIVNISLTDRGRRILEEHETILMNAAREAMTSLTDAELEELSASLRKIQDILAKLQ
jgi:DNA-binding MarR family transcriptional regulator